MNNKKTSNKLGALAGKVLNNPNSSGIQKSLAGSALSQMKKNSQTSSKIESLASKGLTSAKFNKTTKSLAGSLLSQSDKKR